MAAETISLNSLRLANKAPLGVAATPRSYCWVTWGALNSDSVSRMALSRTLLLAAGTFHGLEEAAVHSRQKPGLQLAASTLSDSEFLRIADSP